MRSDLSSEEKDVLIELAEELYSIAQEQKKLSEREAEIKAQIKQVCAERRLPIFDGGSEYLPIYSVDKSLRVTISKTKPKINIDKLKSLLSTEDFLRVAKIKSVDFDVRAWKDLVEEEVVKEEDLLQFVEAPENEENMTLGFGNLR